MFNLTLLANDNRYEGCWENDMKNGSGKYFYLDSGQIFEGFWKNGIPKCGTMRDYGRADAEKPTPLPIPEVSITKLYCNALDQRPSADTAVIHQTQSVCRCVLLHFVEIF